MIFVTGASGLVGAHLIQSLLEKGKSVIALYRKEIPQFPGADKVIWRQGDILDIISLQEAMKDATQVYHCAAIVSFAPGQADSMLHANVEGTANVVNQCLEQSIQKLVFVSSVGGIGKN
jgi:nucleoside-diphosphate-sugar epimerase